MTLMHAVYRGHMVLNYNQDKDFVVKPLPFERMLAWLDESDRNTTIRVMEQNRKLLPATPAAASPPGAAVGQ